MRGPSAIRFPPWPKILRGETLSPAAGGGTGTPEGTSDGDAMGTIEIRPVTAVIGAEIHGVDISEPLKDESVAEIRQALLDHGVIFFRDQHLDDESHLEFALRFGPLSLPPLATKYQDRPSVTVLDQVSPKGEGADEWHSDNTFMPNPPMGSILRAVQLPSAGGDTCFSNMYAAYEALSPTVRSLVDELRAVHDITKPMRKALTGGHTTLDLSEMQQRWPPIEHPVVVTHPETGRRAL